MTLRQNRIDSKKADWEEKGACCLRMQRAVCPAGNWRRVMWWLNSLTRSPWQQRGGLTPLTSPRRWHQPLDWWREGGEDGKMDGKLWAEHRQAAWLSDLLCSSKPLISFSTSTKQTKRRKRLRVSAFPFEFPRIILMLKATHWNRFISVFYTFPILPSPGRIPVLCFQHLNQDLTITKCESLQHANRWLACHASWLDWAQN